MIDGVFLNDQKCFEDERGDLTTLYSAEMKGYSGFAQTYITRNFPGIVRAWHWHQKQTDMWTVVKGRILVGLYDGRKESPTYKEVMRIVLTEKTNKTLVIPPGVVHGYMTLGVEPSMFLNLTDYTYSTEDEFRVDHDADWIEFNWWYNI